MNKLREYFTFTRSERNGILFLLVLIVFLIVLPNILGLFFEKQSVDYSQYESQIDKFISSSQNHDTNFASNNTIIDTIKKEYFYFNPNTVSEIELYKLGISQKLAKTWINFRNKGGKFFDNEDVKKIYGLSDSVFEQIEPYISLPSNKYSNKRKANSEWKNEFKNKSQKVNYQQNNFPKKTTTAIEINNADSTTLCTLPGIGPGYARLIIKYRNKLGGFVKKEQLLEVYGFTQESYVKIEKLILIDLSIVNKINLNTADFKQLIKHPYFSKDMIVRVLEYRKIQGIINNVDEIVKNKMITQDEADKISPYSEF